MMLSLVSREEAISHRRDLELLPREDLVRIFEDVAIGLEDSLPLGGIAILALGDLRQTVAGDDFVDLGCSSARAALHVREIRHVFAHD